MSRIQESQLIYVESFRENGPLHLFETRPSMRDWVRVRTRKERGSTFGQASSMNPLKPLFTARSFLHLKCNFHPFSFTSPKTVSQVQVMLIDGSILLACCLNALSFAESFLNRFELIYIAEFAVTRRGIQILLRKSSISGVATKPTLDTFPCQLIH